MEHEWKVGEWFLWCDVYREIVAILVDGKYRIVHYRTNGEGEHTDWLYESFLDSGFVERASVEKTTQLILEK